ncbi:pyridoxamine 5'-phosphate oxidase family protein [Desulfogranum japonicum]|uniref:pyridoxamine 5'-phosphate oxidase family protein n=1 Tax=Desulfogranum japonicum TaxID=231447 RepID=UPI00042326F4|nr:pyridoxamine 5'-phosphate oxidase family protein [Desulfogranum japonicum]
MNLHTYFSDQTGLGVLSTTNARGEVNGAVYATPHVTGPDTIAFIMRDRLTRANLKENARAHYLFVENGQGFAGVRLHLTMIEEVQDDELIDSLSRRKLRTAKADGERFLVSFKVDKALELIGGDEIGIPEEAH